MGYPTRSQNIQEPYVLQYLSRIHDWQERFVQNAVRKAGYPDLAVSHCEIISFIGNKGPSTAAQIAATILKDRSTVTILVRKLESAGFLRRTPNEADARSTWIVLTADGKRLHRKLLSVFGRLRRTVHNAVPQNDRKILYKSLEALFRNLP
ncbi:MAG: winged helix-turn-helix transcriptional regulator [Leptospiraceae bacterium]|nr:winged helix-turn-helix transcriptional regulator [Leptospiraceae bacterium]